MWRIFVVLTVVVSFWMVYSVYSQPSFPIPEMVVIPSGSFKMGCVSGIDCNDNEKPVHEVKIDSFAMSKYEVTFEEYDAFADARDFGRVDDEGWGRGRRPVINVWWSEAVAYTHWLSDQTGETYRLPTEAEWEYAARAGTETAYSWGDNIGYNRAHCHLCGSRYAGTAPVGSFSANKWGLHDMHGNVREWVRDCWNDNYEGAPTDGSAWMFGDCSQMHLFRGGSWSDYPSFLRSARRGRNTATTSIWYGPIESKSVIPHNSSTGFRVVRDL